MPLSVRDKLGPYEIVSAIGKGGMGEVFRARDPRLNREVAIKTSLLGFSGRFQKEAQAIAALNHPNICTLYDVGPDYLVMEYIEGPTLADRIKQGPVPLQEALGVAAQIAAALEAAHEKSIVHRDLKPANIKLRPDGSVKALDFGLAHTGETVEDRGGNSPTRLSMPTMAGAIMGTAGYLSPEQARGEKVDKRADIFAFGVVLYEMVTGQRLFEGRTVSDSLAAVLTKEPDLSAVPVKVRRLLGSCLEKDAKKRLRDIGDWGRLLDEAASAAPSRLGNAWMIAAAMLAVVAIALGFG
jgi:serine/threonine-protein kinase